MSIKIIIKKSLNLKLVKNHVFFTDQNFRINNLSKLSISKFSSFINKSVSSNNLVNKDIISFNINPSQKIILIKLKNNQTSLEIEKLGARFYMFLKSNSYLKTTFDEQNIRSVVLKNKYFFDQFIQGLQLNPLKVNTKRDH